MGRRQVELIWRLCEKPRGGGGENLISIDEEKILKCSESRPKCTKCRLAMLPTYHRRNGANMLSR